MDIGTALPRLLMAAAAPAMTWLPLNVAIASTTTEVTARAHIYRARLDLVLQSCPRVPLGCMQGGSRWLARDVLLSQSARGGMTRC